MAESLGEAIKTFFSIGGGLAGFASFAYLLRKKFKKDVRIYDLGSYYKVKNSEREGFQDITAKIKLAFLNNNDEAITITDIVGSLKYNKEFYEKITSPINPHAIEDVIVASPTKIEENIHFTIEPHGTEKKEIEIIFHSVITEYIDRLGIAHFTGFLDGKTPLFRVDERELKENWHLHPLTMILSIHINGEKKQHIHISLWKTAEEASHGSFNVVDIEKLKKDIREGKNPHEFRD